MQRARDRVGELTARERLLLDVDDVVADLNRFLRRLPAHWPWHEEFTVALGRLATIELTT